MRLSKKTADHPEDLQELQYALTIVYASGIILVNLPARTSKLETLARQASERKAYRIMPWS
jgi:hypothetical protein